MSCANYDFSLYKQYLTLWGETERDRSINKTIDDFERLVIDNPSYQPDCTRNGEKQRFLITRSETLYRCDIVAFPGEELYPGDIIECFGENWICYQTSIGNPIQITGTIWLCNHLFRWQNNTSEIIERWGVLDSGVYSTTKTSGYEVNTPDVQYKIYLPLDDDTKKLYVDKRIATNIRYDANMKKILEVYKLTRVDPTSQAYGKGAHLLLLNARSDDYIAGVDNLEERICNYIADDTPPDIGDLKDNQIIGRETIIIGTSRKYTSSMDAGAKPVWSISPDDNDNIIMSVDENNINSVIISVLDNEDIIGTNIILRVHDEMNQYNDAKIKIGVIG